MSDQHRPHPTTFPIIRLSGLLDEWFPESPIQECLRLLGEASKNLEEAVAELEKTDYEDLDKEIILESDLQVMESSLGLAFVLLQTYVASVTASNVLHSVSVVGGPQSPHKQSWRYAQRDPRAQF